MLKGKCKKLYAVHHIFLFDMFLMIFMRWQLPGVQQHPRSFRRKILTQRTMEQSLSPLYEHFPKDGRNVREPGLAKTDP